jgi:hypothetical protein
MEAMEPTVTSIGLLREEFIHNVTPSFWLIFSIRVV